MAWLFFTNTEIGSVVCVIEKMMDKTDKIIYG